MSDELKINSNVPVALYPTNVPADHLAALNVEGSIGKGVLALTQDAYGQMYSALGEIHDTAVVVHAAEMERNKASIQMWERTKVLQAGMYMDDSGKIAVHLPAATAQELNSAICDRFDRAAPALDQALQSIRAARVKVDAEVTSSLRDPGATGVEALGIARETRDYVRSLPVSERQSFVTDAINAKDISIVAALLGPGIKPHLSGLSTTLHNALVGRAREVFAPVALKQAAALEWLETNTIAGGRAAVGLLAKNTAKIQPAQQTSLQALNAIRKKKEA